MSPLATAACSAFPLRLGGQPERALPEGPSTVSVEFLYDGGGVGKGGTATLLLDSTEVGRGRIEHTVPGRFGIDTFDVGVDTGSPVTRDYGGRAPFTGTIAEVRVHLEDPTTTPEEAALHARFHAGKEY